MSLKRCTRRTKGDKKPLDADAMKNAFRGVDNAMDEDVNVEDIVEGYFDQATADDKRLDVLITKNMSELCRRLVQCDDDDAAEAIIKYAQTTFNLKLYSVFMNLFFFFAVQFHKTESMCFPQRENAR